jgi:hypothetical protein
MFASVFGDRWGGVPPTAGVLGVAAGSTGQLRVQGGVEAWVWGAAAFAAFTSTQLLARGGYQLLATVCVILVAVTLLFPIVRARVAPDHHAPGQAVTPHRRSP